MEIGTWPIGPHVPLRQNSPGGQLTRCERQVPFAHVALQQGSALVCSQSASAVQPPAPPAAQHSPLPQQVVPMMQETMKKVQNPSWQIPPVQGSASPSWQSASWVHGICCPVADLPRLSQEVAMTPAPIRRSIRRRSVVVAQSRAMRSNGCPFTMTLLRVARSSPSATPEPSMSFSLLTRSMPQAASVRWLRAEGPIDATVAH
jgi:hypothetical protein